MELELHIIPDPGNPAAREVIRAGRTPKGVDRNVECRSSEFLRNCGPNSGQLELSYSTPKLTDIVELPGDRPYQNSAVLHQKYVVEKATMAQIAKEFLCSKSAIRGALVKAGIPLRRRAQPGFASIAYGARVVKGRRVECPAEQRVIATIVDLRGDGMSFDKIAGFLTKMGVPTKTRRKKWNGGCVRRIYLDHAAHAVSGIEGKKET